MPTEIAVLMLICVRMFETLIRVANCGTKTAKRTQRSSRAAPIPASRMKNPRTTVPVSLLPCSTRPPVIPECPMSVLSSRITRR